MDASYNLKAAQDVQHKLEFLTVALAFTIAGYMLQFTSFTGYWYIDLCQTLGCALILISGFVGINRIGYIPVAYRGYVHHIENPDDKVALKEITDINEKKLIRNGACQNYLFLSSVALLFFSKILAEIVKHY